MIIYANLLNAIAVLLNSILGFMVIIIFARAVLSWVNPDPYNPIVRFINSVSDPLMDLVRRRFNLNFGGIDFTPMLVFLIIIFLQNFLVTSIGDYSRKLRIQAMSEVEN